MANGIETLLLRESQVQPVLIILEDLHWIDSETQAFLDSLVESLPAAQILLLINYRLEYAHAWRRNTYYSQFRIDPLPAERAAELLEALLGDDPGLESLKRLLVNRADGNPFFLYRSGERAFAQARYHASARVHLEASVAGAGQQDMRPEVAHCHPALAQLLLRTDRRQEAREHLTTATTMYRDMGMPYWLEKAKTAMADLA